YLIGHGDQVTLISPAGTTLDSAHLIDPDPTGGLPAGAPPRAFPGGFFSFQGGGPARGPHTPLPLGLYPPPGAARSPYLKFRRPARDSRGDPVTPQWYAFSPYDPITDTGAEIHGNEIILHFVDGRRGDDDLTANGVIVDPGGPAFVTAADLSL